MSKEKKRFAITGNHSYDNGCKHGWPEKQLYASVIARAIFDLVVPDPKLRQSADAWLTGRIPGSLTLKTCLEVLNIDPVYMKQLIRSYHSSQSRNLSKMRLFKSFKSLDSQLESRTTKHRYSKQQVEEDSRA